MSKRILVLMFCLITAILLFVTGCTIKDISSNKGDSKNDRTISKDIRFEKKRIPEGWKKIRNKTAMYYTNNWREFIQINEDKMIAYSFYYPNNWKLNDTVFYDNEGIKVAEIAPPVLLSVGQLPYDNWKASPSFFEYFISMKDISFGELSGTKVITKVYNEENFWFPHSYGLVKDNRAFMITFYEKKPNSGQEDLFDQIVSTLKID